jgi:membrane-bound serine protease (ClpP class)
MPEFRVSLALLIPATLITAAFFTFIVGAGLRAQWLPMKAGRETLVGRTAEALTDITLDGGGRVFVDGEDWRAASTTAVARGDRVRITAVQGLSLTVQPLKPEAPS